MTEASNPASLSDRAPLPLFTMSNLLEEIWAQRDVRVDSWPLMSSPLPTLLLCATYFYCVKFLGPRIMKDRKPWECKNWLIAYNLAQVSNEAVSPADRASYLDS